MDSSAAEAVQLDPQADLSELPKPGQVVVYDYCEERSIAVDDPSVFKAVQWNIERGYQLDDIIALLSSPEYGQSCDFLALQELDLHCARSHYRNCAQELARSLRLRCVFVCEFEELWSREHRKAKTQGGGVHGNGLLTWWDVEKTEVIELPAVFDWTKGERIGEPRRGGRYALAAFLRHPQQPPSMPSIIVYSAHLEVFCGIFARMKQFAPILAHARANSASNPHQLILGDLNTMAHGLARFFPKYCGDALRWRSLGWSEAAWWQRNLFDVTDELETATPRNHLLAAHFHSSKPARSKRALNSSHSRTGSATSSGSSSQLLSPSKPAKRSEAVELIEYVKSVGASSGGGLGAGTTTLVDNGRKGIEPVIEEEIVHFPEVPGEDRAQGDEQSVHMHSDHEDQEDGASNAQKQRLLPVFSAAELEALVNPYFYCPFSPDSDLTLQVRGYSGKLDWMLVRCLRILEKGLDNHDYRKSDHKLLWIKGVLASHTEDTGFQEAARQAYRENRDAAEQTTASTRDASATELSKRALDSGSEPEPRPLYAAVYDYLCAYRLEALYSAAAVATLATGCLLLRHFLKPRGA